MSTDDHEYDPNCDFARRMPHIYWLLYSPESKLRKEEYERRRAKREARKRKKDGANGTQ